MDVIKLLLCWLTDRHTNTKCADRRFMTLMKFSLGWMSTVNIIKLFQHEHEHELIVLGVMFAAIPLEKLFYLKASTLPWHFWWHDNHINKSPLPDIAISKEISRDGHLGSQLRVHNLPQKYKRTDTVHPIQRKVFPTFSKIGVVMKALCRPLN